MQIAVIGRGEVGCTYAKAAAAQGMDVVFVDPRPTAAVLSVTQDPEAPLSLDRDELSRFERVWICVPGDAVTAVCAALSEAGLKEDAIVVDLTTASPAVKVASHLSLAASGIAYVDVVIMGAVGVTGAGTALLGAGPGVDCALADFRRLGAATSEIPGGVPGDAVSLKLLRTVITKGLESLAVESLVAAQNAGLRAELYEVLGDVDRMGFVEFLNMLVRTHVVHAERRMHEVRRAGQQLADMRVPSYVLEGSEARFAATTKARLLDPPPSEAGTDIALAVDWLAIQCRAGTT